MSWRRIHIPNDADVPESKARFLVDENLGSEVAILMRELGFNTQFAGDVGLAGKDDRAVFAYAYKHDRMLLTHDTDFLDDRCFSPNANPGVVVLPGGDGDERALLKALGSVVRNLAWVRDMWHGTKIQIAGDEIKVRRRDRTGAMRTWRFLAKRNDDVFEWVDVS